MMARVQVSHSPQETEAIGGELAERLERGQVVLVEGDLGAGKTTFVRGACRALGISAQIRSPTFTIGHRYAGPIPVAHIDLYRIGDLAREDPDLLADYVRSDTIAFVEWPRQIQELAALGPIAARVRIEHSGGDDRRIAVEMPPTPAAPDGQ
jgi:tRNA threonylcarbamoyladenosine biosynthesis protein TsaE